MPISRRKILGAGVALAATGATMPTFASSVPNPFVIYVNGLKNNWVSWSWAKVELDYPISDILPIKVEGGPWSALMLHHDAFSTAGFTKLKFMINGGVDGGQSLIIKAMASGKAIESNYVVKPEVKKWASIEIALKDIGADNTTIDGIAWQGMTEIYKPYYITNIVLE